VIASPDVPDQMVTHKNAAGEPDGTLPKAIGLVLPEVAVVFLVVPVLTVAVVTVVYSHVTYERLLGGETARRRPLVHVPRHCLDGERQRSFLPPSNQRSGLITAVAPPERRRYPRVPTPGAGSVGSPSPHHVSGSHLVPFHRRGPNAALPPRGRRSHPH
jgi:hypothetical protein